MHSIGSCVCANAFSDARGYNKRFHGTRYTSGWLAHDNKHRWTDPERCHPWCSICAKIYLKIHHVYWDMCEIQAQTARLVFLQPSLQLLVSAMHLALLRCESNSSRKLFAFCPNWTASPRASCFEAAPKVCLNSTPVTEFKQEWKFGEKFN